MNASVDTRASQLFGASMLAGPIIGVAAAGVYCVHSATEGAASELTQRQLLGAGLLIGGAIGFMSAPAIAFCLRNKNPRAVRVLLFAATLVAALISAMVTTAVPLRT